MTLISTAKWISDLDYQKEIIITELRADPQIVEQHKSRIAKIFKTADEKEIAARLQDIILRDNAFNAVMAEIVSHFEIKIDEAEHDSFTKKVEQQLKKPLDISGKIAEKVITKTLIFNELAKKWDISISDEEVKKSLEQYYRASNESIREYYDDKEKFEQIRQVMLDETIVNELLKRFKKLKFNLEKKSESTSN